jgi:hypothetical protein
MSKRKSKGVLPAIAFTVLAATSADAETDNMKIRINMNGNEITATLTDNATSRDFASLLPLKLKLEDYGETEKIGYLPRKLATEGAPPGSDPSVGDVSYYAPWGNLAIFRKNFRYSTGLIKFGNLDTSVEALNVPGSVEVTIDIVN